MATPDRPRFAVARKGFEQNEVLVYLDGLGAELSRERDRAERLQASKAELEAEIAELRERLEAVPSLPAAGELDDTAIAAAVGEEMANVIRTARGVAEDLRARATSESEQMLASAREEATEMVRHARAEADETLASARVEATEGLESARAEAARTLEAAKADADALVREAHADADRTRAEATRLFAARTDEANRKMAEATAEAERQAAGIRAKATVEVEAILARASAEAAAMRGEADRERRVALEQAQAARDRILADLARRRRVATVQIEQLRAGRERLLVSYGIVRRTLEEVSDEFQRADAEARAAAEEAGRDLAPDLVDHLGADQESPDPAAGGSHVARGDDEGDHEGEGAGGWGEGRAGSREVSAGEAIPGAGGAGAPDARSGSHQDALHDSEPGGTVPERVLAPGLHPGGGSPEGEAGPFPGLGGAAWSGEVQLASGVSHPSALRAVPAGEPAGPGGATPTLAVTGDPQVIDLRPTINLRSGLASVGEDRSASDARAQVLVGVGSCDDRRGGRPSQVPSVPTVAVVTSEPELPAGEAVDTTAGEVVGTTAGEVRSGDPVAGIFERIRAGRARAVEDARRTLEPESGSPPATGTAAAPSGRAGESGSAAEPVAGPGPVTGDQASAADSGDESALGRREAALRGVARDLTRKLKREMQDEQSELLDRLRGLGDSGDLDALLPPVAEQGSRYASTAAALLVRAALVGASAAALDAPTASPQRSANTDELAAALADAVAVPLRRRVGDLIAELGDPGDREALVDALSAAYREAKTSRVEPVAVDHIYAAHTLGWWSAVADGTLVRWVASDVGGTCSDCDDNTLAGGVPRGGAFPTGQLLPPAHEGCRCLLVAAD